MNQGQHKRIFTRTVLPTAAATRGRFAGKDGEQIAAAGAKAAGVFTDTIDAADITAGQNEVAITILGLEEIEIGAPVALHDPLTSDANGCGVTATAGQPVNGYALELGTAIGQRILALVLCADARPVAAAANPDTAGAALAALETEVNELKAALRLFGIIAT